MAIDNSRRGHSRSLQPRVPCMGKADYTLPGSEDANEPCCELEHHQ
eukprot:CAMPEP_0195021104 /NCGR_PEP_ID=MMETSP0326_2-20130528/37106_1 /TAXON_ID=2866 ORGANISM="Crypthecodinium cohnii, Strain Seligo" /NCGR_SAMPLE_ID=MMETSP0326_2 /ASSEMBLY_ACC=CAM_ASM_000348 /LENGTH=45 /DNA_ID= /DNA_START= /DNA_END= /DNA_ORIENTATION=